MSRSNWKSVQRPMPKAGLSAALLALLAAVMAFGTAGCFLPVLTIIPSVISLAHAVYTMNSGTDDSNNAKNQAAEEAAEAPEHAATQNDFRESVPDAGDYASQSGVGRVAQERDRRSRVPRTSHAEFRRRSALGSYSRQRNRSERLASSGELSRWISILL